MARVVSAAYARDINALSGSVPLILLEISHPALTLPIRVVNDNQEFSRVDAAGAWRVFQAFPFLIELPEQQANQRPSAKLTIDNVGRELTRWIESTGGGAGATCRIIQVARSIGAGGQWPTCIEWEMTLEMTNIVITQTTVSANLGFEDLLGRPAVKVSFRPDNAPGLF